MFQAKLLYDLINVNVVPASEFHYLMILFENLMDPFEKANRGPSVGLTENI